MLLFRSEEHVDRWCRQWSLPRGGLLALERAWHLASAWFEADRRAPEWQRPPIDEVEALFARLGLTGMFWALR
jgi:hypothetical protein